MELGEGTVKTRLRRGREMIKERILYGAEKGQEPYGKGEGFQGKALKEGGKDAD